MSGHAWGWPRRRGGVDIQTCTDCGAERESSVQFSGSDWELRSMFHLALARSRRRRRLIATLWMVAWWALSAWLFWRFVLRA